MSVVDEKPRILTTRWIDALVTEVWLVVNILKSLYFLDQTAR